MLVTFLNILWMLTSIFMILVILVQRGRGGGLAGALGGVGGSSAFGTRAGDLFTRITVGVFAFWLLLGMALVPLMTREDLFKGTGTGVSLEQIPTETPAGGLTAEEIPVPDPSKPAKGL